jgi:hypothetical protein
MSVPMSRREVLTTLYDAAEALRTDNHDRVGHVVVDPANCPMCEGNALADRVEAVAETLSHGTLDE